jgi:hypothetical protein
MAASRSKSASKYMTDLPSGAVVIGGTRKYHDTVDGLVANPNKWAAVASDLTDNTAANLIASIRTPSLKAFKDASEQPGGSFEAAREKNGDDKVTVYARFIPGEAKPAAQVAAVATGHNEGGE